MMDFRTLLTQAQIQRIEATNAEIERFAVLPDRFMARELLRLGRAVRRKANEMGDRHIIEIDTPTYSTTLLWTVIPDLAHRLGETEFVANERRRADFVTIADRTELRTTVGHYLAHSDLRSYIDRRRDRTTPDAADLLTHEVVNGNPIAIALDRIAPPHACDRDWCAARIAEVRKVRTRLAARREPTRRPADPAVA